MPTQKSVKNPIISKDAYTTLVTFFFSAAIVTWGTLIIGYVPFTTDKIEWISNEPLNIIIGGVLYGGVLICVFWVYIEKIIPKYVPRNVWILVIDLVALTFMTGAAGTWKMEMPFVCLASVTIFIMTIRFSVALWQEKGGLRIFFANLTKDLLVQLVILYIFYFVLLVIVIIVTRHYQPSIYTALKSGNYDTSAFYPEEFKPPFTVKNLCDKIEIKPNMQAQINTLDWLNELLRKPDFFDNLKKEFPKKIFSNNIVDLIDKTDSYRDKNFSNLKKTEQSAITKLNRLLLEETYPEVTPKSINFSIRLYGVVIFGMFVGLVLTFCNTLSHTTNEKGEIVENFGISNEKIVPSLCPAYYKIPENAFANVAACVFKGQHSFHHLVDNCQDSHPPRLPYHFSRVHAQRDVETQAFIMAYHAVDNKEIELRSMWVYLAHWFDDLFDDYYAETIANMSLEPSFAITDVLNQLDPKLKTLWDNALVYTKNSSSFRNEELLELGMKRLILGGPMFSSRCIRKRSIFLDIHKQLIMDNLTDDYGIKIIIREIDKLKESELTSRYLAYTAKVVVEIWDSFAVGADFNLSMLMNFFYAPGLYYHDSELEHKQDENSADAEESVLVVERILNKITSLIKGLPEEKRKLAVRPVPLFVECFKPILSKFRLLQLYEAFLNDQKIKNVL